MKIYKVTYNKYTNRGLVTEKCEHIIKYCSNEKELNKFLKKHAARVYEYTPFQYPQQGGKWVDLGYYDPNFTPLAIKTGYTY